VAFGSFLALSVLTRWLSLVVPVLDSDEAAHAVGSWVWMDGGRLYTDFIDNKPPLLYAYYALAQLVFGRGLFAVHLFTALVTVPLSALAASAVFGHDRRGLAAAALSLVYGPSFLAHDMLAVNAELVLLAPAAWALAMVSDERRASRPGSLFRAGVLLGVAVLVKTTAAFWLAAVAWAALRSGFHAGRAKRVVALGAGFSVPLLLAWAAFAVTGGAHDMLYWLLWRGAAYATSPVSVGEAVERAASYLVPWLLVTAPLWWAWLRSRPLMDPHRRRLVDGLVVTSLASALAGFRFYPHYFIPAAFALALGAAPAVAEWVAHPRERAGRAFLAATLVVFLAFQAANACLYLGGMRIYRETDPVYRQTVERLAADVCFPGSRLFVWGWAPGFYYEAGLRGARPASRFVVMAQSGLTRYVSGRQRRATGEQDVVPAPDHWDRLMQDLDRSQATYILDTSPAGIYRWDRYPVQDYPRLDRYLAEHYEPMGSVGEVRLFRRRGCALISG
jgi:4-amino-4-deoxy-L-arabinose transferase-like glycosyltransferase